MKIPDIDKPEISRPTIQMKSNSIRGAYKDAMVDKAIDEIHAAVSTVFGPHATDAYILKESQSLNKTYYTRDGKEVLNSLGFDNPVANYVKSILYQAVERQGTKVGDGTTSMAVFYTNLYRELRASNVIKEYSLTYLRRVWKDLISQINTRINAAASKELTQDTMASMIYTCTQDADLTKMFTEKIADKIESGAYVTINRSDSDDEVTVEVNDKPLIKAELLTTLYRSDTSKFSAVPIFVNGNLDIANIETLDILCNTNFGRKINFLFICSGTSQVTRNTIKDYMLRAKYAADKSNTTVDKMLNNIIIMKIPDFNMYPSEMVEDLSVYLYGTENTVGIVSPITFESLIWQTMKKLSSPDVTVEALETFDFDPKHIEMMSRALTRECEVEYSEIDGLKLDLPMNDVAEDRYNKLREAIDAEKSTMKKNDLIRRLKSLYGQFIDVRIGSKLLKDSQRKYELMLDAVVSATNAKTFGALRCNSLCVALAATNDQYTVYPFDDNSAYVECLTVINSAIANTLCDMAANAVPDINRDLFCDTANCLLDGVESIATDNLKFNLNRSISEYSDFFSCHNTKEDEPITVGEFTIKNEIVEPVLIITSILEDSTMMLELACAKMFNIDSFLGNYI